MILPGNFLKLFKKNKKNKIEWLSSLSVLIFCNIFIFLFQDFLIDRAPIDESYWGFLESKSHLKNMQDIYLKTLDPIVVKKAELELKSDPYMFLKDETFWKKAKDVQFKTDQVLLNQNKVIIERIQKAFQKSKAVVFGLGSNQDTVLNWMTYQFTHSNIFHLLANLIFLFITVSLLKESVSDFVILLVYLLSGFAAGTAYLVWNTDLISPVIGASGSIAGLMGFLIVLKGRENVTWTYYKPISKNFGTVGIPAFYIFPIYLMDDFTELLKTGDSAIGAVALNAHVGGALFGFVAALFYLLWSKAASHRVFSH